MKYTVSVTNTTSAMKYTENKPPSETRAEITNFCQQIRQTKRIPVFGPKHIRWSRMTPGSNNGNDMQSEPKTTG
jgi:hypothetical protein